MCDDDLTKFEADGALPPPLTDHQGHVENVGARIWYSCYGSGAAAILLHGGFGHSGNLGYQVPALVQNGYRAILIDSRGHGRSTRDSRPYTYELMASDVLAVMDALVPCQKYSECGAGYVARREPFRTAAETRAFNRTVLKFLSQVLASGNVS
jgi:Serine aminopeptidase, S33